MNAVADLFDYYSGDYDQALSEAIAPSGESREYFARGRVEWLKHCLDQVEGDTGTLLDFGCGDGATTPLLLATLGGKCATGIDVSPKSLEIGRRRYASAQIKYHSIEEFRASGQMDLAYCNGVFHHIAPKQRAAAVAIVNAALHMGGLFSFWENNPWSLATRYIMSRCAFDRDAIMLTPPEARYLLRNAGFEIMRLDFCFIFPRALKMLRKLEKMACRLPLGTQYQILCRKIR
jgi:SAM-dependent methyltransferase